jgi:hypothetical protein
MPDIGHFGPTFSPSNVAISYFGTRTAYVAETVFPVCLVTKTLDKYFVNGDKFSNREYVCGRYRRELSFECAVKDSATTEELVTAASTLSEGLLIDQEIQAAFVAMNPGNYVPSNTIRLDYRTRWSNNSLTNGKYTSDFITDIQNAKRTVLKTCGKKATHILFSHSSYEAYKNNWQQDYILRSWPLDDPGPLVILGLEVVFAFSETIGYDGKQTGIWQTPDNEPSVLIFRQEPFTTQKGRIALGLTMDAPDETTGERQVASKYFREELRDSMFMELRMTRDYVFTSTDQSWSGVRNNGLATAGCLIVGI